MRWVLNIVFWVALVALIFCGCYLIMAGLAALLFGGSPVNSPFIRITVVTASLLLTPIVLAAFALLLNR